MLVSEPGSESSALVTRTVRMMVSPVRISLEMPALGRDWRNRLRGVESSGSSHLGSFLLLTGLIINQLKVLNNRIKLLRAILIPP